MKIEVQEVNGKKKYIVNGTEYHNLEDVPAEFRAFFADKDKDGMPDMLTSFMSSETSFFKNTKEVVDATLSKAKSETYQPVLNNTMNTRKASLSSILVKIGFVVLLLSVAALAYMTYNSSDSTVPLQQSDTTRQIPPAEPVKPEAIPLTDASDSLLLNIEEGDAPSYLMTIVGDRHGEIFQMPLPDGELEETPHHTISVALPTDEQIGLLASQFIITAEHVSCPVVDEDGTPLEKIRIGDETFYYASDGDAGAGKSYTNFHYSIYKSQHCITFSLEDEISIQNDHVDDRQHAIEALIGTVKFTPSH